MVFWTCGCVINISLWISTPYNTEPGEAPLKRRFLFRLPFVKEISPHQGCAPSPRVQHLIHKNRLLTLVLWTLESPAVLDLFRAPSQSVSLCALPRALGIDVGGSWVHSVGTEASYLGIKSMCQVKEVYPFKHEMFCIILASLDGNLFQVHYTLTHLPFLSFLYCLSSRCSSLLTFLPLALGNIAQSLATLPGSPKALYFR